MYSLGCTLNLAWLKKGRLERNSWVASKNS